MSLGPRASGFYVVLEGVTEGDRVVTRGAFKLDAELQIRAKPSMMSPDGGAPIGGHAGHGAPAGAAPSGVQAAPGAGAGSPDVPPSAAHSSGDHSAAGHMAEGRAAGAADPGVDPAFMEQLATVVGAYLDIQVALAADDGAQATALTGPALEALARVDMALVKGDDHVAWMTRADSLQAVLRLLADAGEMDLARQHFAPLSEQMLALVRRFGTPGKPLYQAYCPMALNFAGATWIQDGEEINNPYLGAAMLRCGDIREVLR